MLVDTHCHLADPAYEADREAVLGRAVEAGVERIVVIGETPETAARAFDLAARDSRLAATAGLHPHEARRWDASVAEWLRGALADSRAVAAGEMGLDYHYDHSPREVQRACFDAQLAIAEELGKPAVIHAREADDDVAAALRAHPGVTAILHSFSSGPDLLRAGVDLGHYVSFSGMVTFRNWRLDDAIRATPPDRLLIETDGPYLAPVPHRGKRNEPGYVRLVAEQIARVLRLDVAELMARTGANAERVFGFARTR
ncbi:MAG TPA: TatD family hydrolase [Gemmatimonadales bacterium]|nr:TatD family hydrolase [Gemmatimonadales bacterium]